MHARPNSDDAHLRARERARLQVEDRLQLIVDRLRSGAVTPERVLAAARLGSPEARALLGQAAPAPELPPNEFVEADTIMSLGDLRLVISYLADCVEHDLWYFERVSRDQRPHRAIEFVRRWIATGKIARDPLRKIEAMADAAQLAGHSVSMDAADSAYDTQRLVELLQLVVDQDPDAIMTASEVAADTYCLQSADPYTRERMIEYLLGDAP